MLPDRWSMASLNRSKTVFATKKILKTNTYLNIEDIAVWICTQKIQCISAYRCNNLKKLAQSSLVCKNPHLTTIK